MQRGRLHGRYYFAAVINTDGKQPKLSQTEVDHLGLVLGGDARDQALLLRLRDAELVVGVLDVLGQVLPALGLLLGGAHEVLDVVEVDTAQVASPSGHRLALEVVVTLEASFEHPVWLALFARNVADYVLVNATLCCRSGIVFIRPAKFIDTKRVEF